ncbi:MAG: hypothetical protein AABX05_00970, partial [Nanoarchaeota archaeon]
DGKGLGQARKIVRYANNSNPEIIISPAWDVIPDATSKVSITRAIWNSYMVDNQIDIRGCLKSNANLDNSGYIGWWSPSLDSTIEGNKQYDSNGIVLGTQYLKDSIILSYSGEVRNNLVDGEYKYPASYGGIDLWYGSWYEYPNPVLGNDVVVSHNQVRNADGLRGGGLGVSRSWHTSANPYWKEILMHHNSVKDVDSAGINIEASFVWNSVLYKNTFEDVPAGKEIVDHGTNTVIVS